MLRTWWSGSATMIWIILILITFRTSSFVTCHKGHHPQNVIRGNATLKTHQIGIISISLKDPVREPATIIPKNHLCLPSTDSYLSKKENVVGVHLQLLGILLTAKIQRKFMVFWMQYPQYSLKLISSSLNDTSYNDGHLMRLNQMHLYRRFLYLLLVVGVRKDRDVIVEHVNRIVVVQRTQRDYNTVCSVNSNSWSFQTTSTVYTASNRTEPPETIQCRGHGSRGPNELP